ncbi:hypothetical protein HDV01_001847 [Terramyces sp. JEL0728]|nr:hypothetical protein HDV01_001847 [Terramyces sp. JEL0728]
MAERQTLTHVYTSNSGLEVFEKQGENNTSQQPGLPSSYGYREGNAGMLGLLGFFLAVFPSSILEGISPKISQQAIFPYLTVFGGFLQLLAGNKDYYLGNSYTACIFTVFGFHWVAKGLIESGIQLIQPVVGQTSDEDRPTVIGMYLLTLTIVNAVFLVISWHHPKSSTLLFFTLLFVTLKMLGETIGAFSGVAVIGQISAWFGVVGSLLALYTFIAEAYAEEGVVLPTGKFNQVITKKQVKQKRD